MKKDSAIDYWGYILIRLIGPLIRSLPVGVSMFLGARLGELLFCLDRRHRAVVYANIKGAFPDKFSPKELNCLVKDFYRAFGQSIIEVLLIPAVDEAYINKYVAIEGREYAYEALNRGKGVILVGVHAGSWELSNVICANLGFPFNLFIRVQKYPRLNGLLNSFRRQQGCKFIQREGETRQLIKVLKNNEAIGMSADQGGRSGIQVKFFGRYASMPSGAIRLAMKYDACIVPAFYTRLKGPYVKAFVEPPLELKRTGDTQQDIKDNLQALVNIFERYISKYPKDYLWTYKAWKYGTERDILILSDGKTGHLRQSEGIAGIARDILNEKGISANIRKVEVKFRGKNSRVAMTASCIFSGKYGCQGCGWCMRKFLEDGVYKELSGIKPDIVISCGSQVAPVNYVVSRENLAKSIVLMRPSIFSVNRFDLVVMSRHDNPPRRRNVVEIEGALNTINEDSLKGAAEGLKKLGVKVFKEPALGILIGGDAKGFRLTGDMMSKISGQVKAAAGRLGAELLITTSRRTSPAVEGLLKREFSGYGPCKLLVIANEKNIHEAVEGITALSDIVITSPESISMISEAVKSGRYVIVFDSPGLSGKHRRFLGHFAGNKYVALVEADKLAEKIEEVWLKRPEIEPLKDDLLVREAIKKIL
ncbi:MAG: ELM1/GtrOC1 family putative glycosyltransferase [Candidatus Omnitrophota bacterium]|jgi:lauroyl/myristoyl acyltransferase/mitochondrial fission protein ELM1